MTSVEFGCRVCHKAVEAEPGTTVPCRHCEAANTLPDAPDTLGQCVACECPELYRHRDFNQKLGIFLIALGAVLCLVLLSFWPLAIAAVLDFVLYKTLPDVGICYRCKAHHRGFDNVKSLPAFDLERHEHYRFVRAREEGRLEPRPPDAAPPPTDG